MDIIDQDLGTIRLIANIRARRIIARVRGGVLEITHPEKLKDKEIVNFIDEFRPRLRRLKETARPIYLFLPHSDLVTYNFVVRLRESSLASFYTELKDGQLTVSYPKQFDYESEEVQSYTQNIVEKALRREAKRVLPPRVANLAQTHGFTFAEVKINKSQGRWGSCSSKRSINLSYYCMLLPEYLIDFVILHELCHTLEMNHGAGFWCLLDQVSGGKAQIFTKELKKHHTTRW